MVSVLTTRMHVMIAGLLTLAIIGAFLGSDAALKKQLQSMEASLLQYDRQWCERINAMHRLNSGITVLDCESGEILVRDAE